jgi:hypothetical protein
MLNVCMESKAKQGGKRPGAGRKPGPNVWVRLPVPRQIWAMIEADAKRNGRTPEAEAVRLLERWAASPLFT